MMYQVITTNIRGKEIEFYLTRKSIKNIYFRIIDKKLYISAPRFINISKIKEAITQKSKWIYDKLNRNVKEKRKIQSRYYNNDYAYLLGIKYQIKFIENDTIPSSSDIYINNNDKCIYIYCQDKVKYQSEDSKSIIITNIINKLYINTANDVIYNLSKKVAKKTGLIANKISIKELKRAWGYCSSKKDISINIDCVMYDKEVIESIILHEYCHLKYMNHSKIFWNMVLKYMPNYKDLKKRLDE